MSGAGEAIRVMLVDDHKTMLWGLDRLIEGQSPRMRVVGQASTCEQALACANAVHPDIILLDLDLDGHSSLDILPDLVAVGQARALVLTAMKDTQVLDLAIARGARGVVRKDAEAAVVLKAIEKVHDGELWINSETLTRVFFDMMGPGNARKPTSAALKHARLTPQERKVIDAVVAGSGAPNKVLARQLFISEHTLRNHLTSVYEKLGVNNRLELYIYATKYKLQRA